MSSTVRTPPASSAGTKTDRSVTFIMPAFNEERNLEAAVGEVRKVTDTLGMHYEIVIVDDGSTDNTGKIADAISAQDARVRVVHHLRNLGLGAAYRRGVTDARMAYVMMVPGDNAHPADGLQSVIQAIGETDVVIAYPLNPGARPVLRRILSRLYTSVLNVLFGLNIPYYNGLNVYRTAAIRQIVIETNSFAYSSEIVIKLLSAHHSHRAVGTMIEERAEGKSKAIRVKNILAVLRSVLRMWVKVRMRHNWPGSATKAAMEAKDQSKSEPGTHDMRR